MERDEYRRMAEVEDAHWWYRATRALLADQLVSRVPAGGLFLDAGCGTGATGAWLGEHGTVVGVDAQPLALELYGRRAGVAGFAAGDLAALPFASSSFDAALCVTVLYHRDVASPAAAVRELVRVVRPGGYVCVLEPGVRRLHRAHDREVHGARRFSLGDVRSLVRDAGCDIVNASGAYSFLVPPAAVKALLERGDSSSDLDRHAGGLGGLLGRVAAGERALLRRSALPFGLSVFAIGRVR